MHLCRTVTSLSQNKQTWLSALCVIDTWCVWLVFSKSHLASDHHCLRNDMAEEENEKNVDISLNQIKQFKLESSCISSIFMEFWVALINPTFLLNRFPVQHILVFSMSHIFKWAPWHEGVLGEWRSSSTHSYFVDSPYYSKSELCRSEVTVSFSKYLPWQAMYFLQRSTHFSKTCCTQLITSKFLTSEIPFHGWKSLEIGWCEIWTVWRMI